MNRIPIYQMSYSQDSDGNLGLVFTSEQELHDNRSIMFVVPLIEPFRHPFEFIGNFEHQSIYFPFLLGEKYYELEAKINFPDLEFTIPEKNIKITFSIGIDNFINWNFIPFRQQQNNFPKYIGKHNKLLTENNGFLSLAPVDLYEMDELYNEHQGVFVGLTPNFGVLNDNTQG